MLTQCAPAQRPEREAAAGGPVLIRRRALLTTALAAPVLGGQIARAQDVLLAAARREGTLTWYNGYIGDTVAQDMAGRFERAFPGIKLVTIRSTSQVAFQRLRQDQQAGLHNCDVYSSSDISHFDSLAREQRLMPYTPANAARIDPALQGKQLYAEAQYYPALISMMALAYNSQHVSAADAPKQWPDLLDPRWKGKLAVGHPGFSGYAGTWALLMQQMYGDGFFDQLAANKPLVGRSSNDSVTQLNSAERIVAASPAYVAIESGRRGNPVVVNYPTDGALLMVSPAGIMADAPHPAAAKLFMEWLLGPENSTLLVQQGAVPINQDVPHATDQPALAAINTRRPTVAEIVKGIPEVAERWRDALGG
jgi:iron(III) transport system substrate-binding protein